MAVKFTEYTLGGGLIIKVDPAQSLQLFSFYDPNLEFYYAGEIFSNAPSTGLVRFSWQDIKDIMASHSSQGYPFIYLMDMDLMTEYGHNLPDPGNLGQPGDASVYFDTWEADGVVLKSFLQLSTDNYPYYVDPIVADFSKLWVSYIPV